MSKPFLIISIFLSVLFYFFWYKIAKVTGTLRVYVAAQIMAATAPVLLFLAAWLNKHYPIHPPKSGLIGNFNNLLHSSMIEALAPYLVIPSLVVGIFSAGFFPKLSLRTLFFISGSLFALFAFLINMPLYYIIAMSIIGGTLCPVGYKARDAYYGMRTSLAVQKSEALISLKTSSRRTKR